MSRAIQLARRGRYTCDPNPVVGCVITRGDRVVSEGWHRIAGQAHAEINALEDCDNPAGAKIYLTLEPCSCHGKTPPCVDALIGADIKEVVIAMLDPNPKVSGAGVRRLEQAGIDVRQGLLEAEAKSLNSGFIKRMTTGLPHVICKLAMTLDARTALSNGDSRWISSEPSRRDVHKIRATSSAILTSISTVNRDDPVLTARAMDFEIKQPARVVIDRALKLSADARLLTTPGRTIIYTAQQNRARVGSLTGLGAEVVVLVGPEFELSAILSHMARVYEMNTVLVEAGAGLSGALIEKGLVDELLVYLAPSLFGHDANPLLRLPAIDNIDDAIQLKLENVLQIGDDLRLTYNFNDQRRQ